MNVNNYYDYRYARRLAAVVVLVLACSVAHTNCTESEKSKTTELGNTNENPQILSAVASAIQHCVDKKTMNSKKFKKRLDDLYNDAIKPTMQKSLDEYMIKVKEIQKQYQDDVKILKKMNSNNIKNDKK